MDSISTRRGFGGESPWPDESRPLVGPYSLNGNGGGSGGGGGSSSLAGASGMLHVVSNGYGSSGGLEGRSHGGHHAGSLLYDSDDEVRGITRSPMRRLNISLSSPVEGHNGKLRVDCIDVMRGLVVLITVFVSTGHFTDPGWDWIGHEPWDGLYLGDCVWPMYLTVMGASMAFTFRKECSAPTKAMLYSLKRCVLLCLLGIFLKNFHSLGVAIDLSSLRFQSELGRVGVCYFVVACMLIYLPRLRVRATPSSAAAGNGNGAGNGASGAGSSNDSRSHSVYNTRSSSYSNNDDKYYNSDGYYADGSFSSSRAARASAVLVRSFPELALYAWAWVVTALLIIFYLGILFSLPVPGCPQGYLGPGGTSEGGAHFNCTGGATRYIDMQIFSPQHVGIWAGCQQKYSCVQIDSCSVLGTLPSILHVMFGVLTGNILVLYRMHDPKAVVKHMVSWAVVMGLLGTILHFTAIPINKTLWSLSFVLVTAGIANATLAAIYACMDWCMHLRFWVLRSVGINPLLLYLFAVLLEPVLESLVFHNDRKDSLFHYIYDEGFVRATTQEVAHFLWACTVTTATILLSIYFRKQNILVTL